MDDTNCSLNTQVYERKPVGFCSKLEIAAVYVNINGKLLLLELSHEKLEAGAWGVPAGKLESNETAENGAKRELFEEAGIEITYENTFKAFGKLYIRKPGIDYVYHLFELHLTNEPEIRLSREHQSYKWVVREEAEKLPLMNGAKQALDFYYRHSKSERRLGA